MTNTWIHTDHKLTDIEQFINAFMSCGARTDTEKEALERTFTQGYCWHFAHLLQTTFKRGSVVLAAPFSHVCFKDTDGKIYDIDGKYYGEAYYFIPEDMAEEIIPNCMADFKHIPGNLHSMNKDECIYLMQEYCRHTGQEYDKKVEDYLIPL